MILRRVRPPTDPLSSLHRATIRTPTHLVRSSGTGSGAHESPPTTLPLAFDFHGKQECRDTPARCKAPIVVLHGLFGSKVNNRGLSRQALINGLPRPPAQVSAAAAGAPSSRSLSARLSTPIYTLDLRNHGASPHHPHHTYSALAADVEAFLRTHGLAPRPQPSSPHPASSSSSLSPGSTSTNDSHSTNSNGNSTGGNAPPPSPPPILLGHSMGAKTAMAVALRGVVPLTALVVVDMSPVDAPIRGGFERYVRGMREVERAGARTLKEAGRVLEPWVEDATIRAFLLQNLHKPADAVAYRWRIPLHHLSRSLGHMGDFPFQDPDATRWEGPALFVRGTRSPYVPDEDLPAIGAFFPRFEMRDVDAGHWLISERMEEFQRLVVEFVEGLEGGEAGQ